MSKNSTVSILLIEDDQEDVDIFTELVKSVSTNVFFSVISDGDIAVKMLTSGECRPDVIFLDLKLPRMDGMEVLEHLRDAGLTARLPIYVHSDCDDGAQIQKCLSLGAVKFLVKSPDNWLLKSTLIELLLAKLLRTEAR